MNKAENPVDPARTEPHLLERAETVSHNAHARYSGFFVGTAIRTKSGGVYASCNVENVSFPVGTCAERNTIAAAVAAEGPEMEIETLVLVASKDGQVQPCTPCGACRQAIAEFGQRTKIYHRSGKGWRCDSIGDLLPFGFTFEM